MTAADYSAVETLRNGQRLEIRALRPEDRDEFAAAATRLSAESLYRRFFSAKRHFSEQERSFFVDVDFINHVALIAVLEEGGGRTEIVGGARYVVTKPGEAEVAFAVVDQYDPGSKEALLMLMARIEDGIIVIDTDHTSPSLIDELERAGVPADQIRVAWRHAQN